MKRLIRTANKLVPREMAFANHVKSRLHKTNFDLIGEELIIKKPRRGQCDLWLANLEHKDPFLLSLELKVGKSNDKRKFNKLKEQVNTYTKAMQLIYPEHKVYGIGAYKTYCNHTEIITTGPIPKNVIDELKYLVEIT